MDSKERETDFMTLIHSTLDESIVEKVKSVLNKMLHWNNADRLYCKDS